MAAYIIRRLLFMLPTLLGIMLVAVRRRAIRARRPGRAGDRQAHRQPTPAQPRAFPARPAAISARAAVQGGSQIDSGSSKYRGAQGLDPAFIKSLEKQFGFDKPAYERFGLMLWNYARFDFGKSYFRDISVLELIKEKLPVSMSLGIWMTLLTYLISIPLGIKKAIDDGTQFDVWTLGHHHRRLFDPRLPVRHPADHPVRRRLVLRFFSAARAVFRELVAIALVRRRSSTISGI